VTGRGSTAGDKILIDSQPNSQSMIDPQGTVETQENNNGNKA
jgi:hypothetical protein